MSEGLFEPAPRTYGAGDLSAMQTDADEIVARLLKGKEGRFTSLSSESAEDLFSLFFAGYQSGGDDLPELPELPELEDPEDFEVLEEFVADDEDVESIMSELLEAHPDFAVVDESERREIVVRLINAALAEG